MSELPFNKTYKILLQTFIDFILFTEKNIKFNIKLCYESCSKNGVMYEIFPFQELILQMIFLLECLNLI